MPPEVCLSFFHCTTIQVNTWVTHDKIQKFIDPPVSDRVTYDNQPYLIDILVIQVIWSPNEKV